MVGGPSWFIHRTGHGPIWIIELAFHACTDDLSPTHHGPRDGSIPRGVLAMLNRREAIIRVGPCALVLGWLGIQRPGRPQDRDVRPQSRLPEIAQPILFNTPEADRILESLQVFPPDNPWNADISDWPLHPNSRNLIASIGADKPLRYNADMSFVLVPPNQRRIPVKIGYTAESDPGPFPVPENLPLEAWPAAIRRDPRLRRMTLDDVQRAIGGDRHAIVVDPVNGMLYEFYQARKTDAGWEARIAATFDLKTNRLRPEEWTSTDAAGLPIFPAVVRYDELQRGRIGHALRVTVQKTRRAYVAPARHFASQSHDRNRPRMGERIRLRRDYETSGFSPEVRTILEGLKRYGMFVADNGIDWAISVTPDERIPVLNEELRRVKGSAFEVVQRPA
jgi:hypothetical protein